MKPSLLRNMTWEDIREITLATLSAMDKGCPLVPDCYKDILRILRGKNGVPPPIEETYPHILACAESACGRKLEESRDKENTLIRCFVAYKLHNSGYSYSEIGKVMHRDHSTITHLANRMRDMLSLPNAYKLEVQQFKRFEEIVK